MKPVFCFIDDARFELDLFRKNAAPYFNRVDFVYAMTSQEASGLLTGKRPLLFLLDIYGASSDAEPHILTEDELSTAVGPQGDLSEIYTGLDELEPPEAGNAFLRRLHARGSTWAKGFSQAAEALGQSRQYGLGNLAWVRAAHPQAAALGYSRKANYEDAVAMHLAGAEGVLQKPQGVDEEAIALATRDQAGDLAQAAYNAVTDRLVRLLIPLTLRFRSQEGGGDMADALSAGLRAMGAASAGAAGAGEEAGRCGEELAALVKERGGLNPMEVTLVAGFCDWLESFD